MGVRGEIFSSKVALANRTYFFNVKENRMGDLYLNIVESKNRDNGGFERQSVILFADDLKEFLKGFDDSLRVLEKAVREKKRTPSEERFPKAGGSRFERKSNFNDEGKPTRNEPKKRSFQSKNNSSRRDNRHDEKNRGGFNKSAHYDRGKNGSSKKTEHKKHFVVKKHE